MPPQDDRPHGYGWRRYSPLPIGVYRNSVPVFLAALILFIITTPFSEQLPDPGFVEALLLTLVLICGVLAGGGRRGALALSVLLALGGLGAIWVHHFRPDWVAPGVHLAFGILLLAVVAFHLLRFILRAPQVDAEVLSAGIATYLVLGLMWALAYLFVAWVAPDALVIKGEHLASRTLDGFHALYFSFITLCTIGYGDIVPATPVAKMLAVVEGIMGVLYPSILIARLVTLYSDKPR